MLLELLNAKHPSYDADTWCKYDALYRGGKKFREHIGEFLKQNEVEPVQVYARRRDEAYYRSYLGPIVDFFAAQLFTAPMVIRARDAEGEPTEADPFYSSFKEDVDGLGLDLIDFMRSRFVTALVKCASWWA